jgi:heat shock protein HtpX
MMLQITDLKMNLWKLRLSMAATLAIIIGLSTLVFTVVLSVAGIFDLITLGILVVAFNIVQWLIAPYLIGALYRVRSLPENENPALHQAIADLSRKSGISAPKLMIAQIPIPNAFAYGSPLSGSRVAVTQGLLTNLNPGEVEAVIGHELGHLKHKDVQLMMALSFLPALFTYIAYSFLFSGMSGNSKDRGSNGALIGIGFMAFAWVLNICILSVSRMREYYADSHSASIVDNGADRLSTGLAKIIHASKKPIKVQQQKQAAMPFKALFITDLDRATVDSAVLDSQSMVQDILSKKITTVDRFGEIFSTHPNIVKRLKALQELSQHNYS